MKIRQLIRDTALYGFSSAVTRVFMLILIPIFISALTVNEFGIVSLFQFYMGIGIILFLFGLDHALMREFPAADTARRRDLVSTCILFLGASAGVSALFFLIFRNAFTALLFRDAHAPEILVWLWLIVFGESATLVQSVVYRAEKKADLYFRNTMVKYASLLLFSWILLKPVRAGLNGVFLAYLGSNCLYALFSIRIWRSYVRIRFSSRILRGLLKYGLPLLPAGLLNLFLFFADHVLIQRLMGLEAVGLYAFGYKFGAVIYYLVGALNNAWYPRLFSMKKAELEVHYHRLLVGAAWISMAVFLMVDSAFRFFHPWFVPKAYAPSVRIVTLVGLAYIVHNVASFADCLFFYAKKVGIVPLITGISLAVNLLMNGILIPRMGIAGAALATLAAFFAHLILMIVFLKKRNVIPLRFGETAALAAGFAVPYAASRLIMPDAFIARLASAAALILLFFILSWMISPTLRNTAASALERIKKRRNP